MIRKAVWQDVDAIADGYRRLLAHEAATHSYTNWKPGIYPVRADAERALESGTLYVLEEDGQICASMILNRHQAEAYAEMDWQYPADPEQVLVIHTLTMPPEMSGRGYGTRMVRFAMEEARRMGVNAVVAIADEGGNLKLCECMDHSYLASRDIAINKSYTSVALKMSTKKLSTLAAPGASLYGIQFTNGGRIVIFGGGDPLKNAKGAIIGGLGVSGGSEEQDTKLSAYGKRYFESNT